MAYVYTLSDVYKIFQQSDDKIAQLKEFQSLNLPYNIEWDRLIEVHSQPKKMNKKVESDDLGA